MLNVIVSGSHRKSYNFPFRYFFRIIINPEKLYKRQGTHIEILLDTSESMWHAEALPEFDQYKTNCRVVDGVEVCDYPQWVLEYTKPPLIQQALEALKEILAHIPEDNLVSIYTFSDEVIPIVTMSPPTYAYSQLISKIRRGSQETRLYTALNLAKDADEIIVITDGSPTDPPSRVKEFSGKVIFVGVGKYYNESVLRALADQTNGLLYHVDNLDELFNIFAESVKEYIGAQRVRVFLTSEFPVNLINYSGNPINIGTLEGPVRIYGYIDLPPNFSGKLLEVKVKYNVLEKEEEIKKELYITTASSKEDFVQNIDQDIVAEGMWYHTLRNLNEQNLNQTINVLKNIAESTKRLDLLEYTRKLADIKGDTKRLNSEVTKRLRK
jgi:Ca-activated chloride channel family protein